MKHCDKTKLYKVREFRRGQIVQLTASYAKIFHKPADFVIGWKVVRIRFTPIFWDSDDYPICEFTSQCTRSSSGHSQNLAIRRGKLTLRLSGAWLEKGNSK